jgi:flagellar basal body-associated protein FliL
VADPSEDDSEGEISIVGEGEAIVVNPANSGGTRYLLVEIYLTRGDKKDKGFKTAIDSNSKKLQAVTMAKLSEHDVQELSDSNVRARIKDELKLQYQRILGAKEHPIDELVITKWIMQ